MKRFELLGALFVNRGNVKRETLGETVGFRNGLNRRESQEGERRCRVRDEVCLPRTLSDRIPMVLKYFASFSP